ncbi:LysR family transcriptional regulator [Actinomadura opuntiae]|uniref:LysR family transcriptional regulator n=1 Tax=Actinomadura sp. OS1-43 TaxID=604315 RepID=UPI00255AFD49|nr:LysR family transcriptional regulator [Actinomadura sp. OS1-43]MDL4813919.1 LysR family transcriptional regulator [Actinomadura sp. OS1-43]
MHSRLDLNLLVALDALLEEGSVTGAAERLHLSGPAMSRTLGRIRKAIGDPVLVRSGRAMVPTPRALAMRAEVHELVQRAYTLFSEDDAFSPRALEGTFTLQAEEGTISVLSGPLLERIAEDAPGVRLRFLGEGPRDTHLLRRASIDLEIGVITDEAPDTRVEPLLEDRFSSVVRPGHPLADREVPLDAWCAAKQVTNTRRGRLAGPIDELLAGMGRSRRVAGTVPTVAAALLVVRGTDLLGFAAERLHRPLVERLGLVWVPIPFPMPPLNLSLAWHARYDADPAHAWLRRCVRETVADIVGG